MASAIQSITIVCTGNTCRSPMAERLLRHALAASQPPLNTISVQSAGIAAFSGDDPSPNAVNALAKVGLDLSDHRATRLSPQLIDASDCILVMTPQHRDAILLAHPEAAPYTFLFRQFASPSDPSVPDPFGQSLSAYLETRDALVEAIPAIIDFLRNQSTPKD